MRIGWFGHRWPALLFLLPCGAIAAPSAGTGAASPITVRTEIFARPPYSGATYYIYEQDGRTICTKLAVCNKFDDCDTRYIRGAFKDDDDTQDAPSSSTAPVVIPARSLARHVCLTRFGLLGGARRAP